MHAWTWLHMSPIHKNTLATQELRIKNMFHPVHGDNDMQILCQVPEKLRVSGPGRDTVRQRSAANSIVSSSPDSTEGEQSDGNCENPRSQWAVKAAIMLLAVVYMQFTLLKYDNWFLSSCSLSGVRCPTIWSIVQASWGTLVCTVTQ